MVEYSPRLRHGGLSIPFGWYVNPLDEKILVPDKHKLDCLHYAFRMRAKYKTSIRDCTMWLHSATGQRMSPAGFMYAYNRWMEKIKKERKKEIHEKKKAEFKKRQEFVDENMKHFGIVIDDSADIAAVASYEAQKDINEAN